MPDSRGLVTKLLIAWADAKTDAETNAQIAVDKIIIAVNNDFFLIVLNISLP